ncbi:MAG: ABC transporter transmembrane domain-containing protein, partial [Gammaproteobacteria bacterium]
MDQETKTKQKDKQLSQQTINDPLLACLILLTKYHERPRSARALVAGLPLENDRLTPELFIRAATHADLEAQIQPCPIEQLKELPLPAVLLLENQDACLLLSIEKSGHKAQILFPNKSSESQQISAKDLSKIYGGYSIAIKPVHIFTQRSEETLDKKSKSWFWQVMWKAWPIYRKVLVASFMTNLFALAIPLFIMNVYDRVVPNHAIETMWVLASGVAIVFLFDFTMRTLRSYFIDHAGKQVDMTLSADIFEQILGIKMAHRPNSVGSFVNTVQSFEIFRDFITSTTVTVLVDLPFVFLYIFIIYLVGGSLFLIPTIMVPIVFLVGTLLQLPLTKLTQESYRYAAEKQATLIESLSGVEAIKSTSAEGTMQRRWERIVELLSKVGLKLRFVSNLSVNFTLFVQQLTTILVVIFGVYMISEGEITVGALIACTILTGRALAPMSQVAALLSRYYQSVTAIKSLNTVMH